MTVRSIKELVSELEQFKPGAPLLHYITHARFPNFKGLERNAWIDFPFPFTALVGANGIGKSSVLHALHGMPEGESTAKFWFSTALDPIQSKALDPPRYIYGHWHNGYGGAVETRKARVFSKKREYEYWEPTKATKRDSMAPIPSKAYARKDADRWNAVEREIVYMNMKVVIGAFDRTFNFGKTPNQLAAKHAEMRTGATKLKSIVERQATSWRVGGGRERVFENRPLSAEELSHASRILGRNYQSAQYIRHSLYPNQQGGDVSVIFDRGFKYSEAFAGSGEVAIVSVVVKVLSAARYALVLLDEPETSLHPGAQRELLRFLLGEIKRKHLQVVVSTHSIEFLEDLPHKAIKVFEDNGNGKSRVLNECSPYIALNRLGKPATNKKRVYVEDRLAQAVVERAAEGLDAGEQSVLEIVVAQGGARGILANQVPTHISAGTDCYILLDGDQKKVDCFTDPDSLPLKQHNDLEKIIRDECGCKPTFALNGGNDKAGNAQDKIQKQLQYMRWVRSRVSFLPHPCPDAVVLESQEREGLVNSDQFKKALYEKIGAGQTPEGALGVVKYLLEKLPENNADLAAIRAILKRWLLAPE
ncbi:MAG: ATP-binding protein [Pseudomonas sp.]|nr:ATP-binding protein [Pseudomonas sp.]